MEIVNKKRFKDELYKLDCIDKFGYVIVPITKLNIALERSEVDAVPVVHAKMMRTDAYPHRIYCGNCYKTLIPNEEYCFERNEFPKWCMWCGAKMDEEG